jgi:hypothetical protein
MHTPVTLMHVSHGYQSIVAMPTMMQITSLRSTGYDIKNLVFMGSQRNAFYVKIKFKFINFPGKLSP